MPRQSSSQETGRIGERWFVSQLPPNWVFQPPLEDVGIDGVVVICGSGPADGLEFRVQIKSSAEFTRRGDALVVPNIKRSTLRYWVTGFTPTLLVAFETSSGKAFCAWANELLAARADLLDDTNGMAALELHTRMPVTDAAWAQIREQLSGLYAAIGRRLLVAGTVAPFLAAINALSGALKGLYFAEAARPREPDRTPEQRRLMQELEVTSHCDVVRAIIALQKALAENGIALDGLNQYADEYAERCSSIVRGFRDSVFADGVVKCEVIPEGLALERRPLMNSIAGTLHELTQAAVHAHLVQGRQ